MQNYKDLKVWEKAHEFALAVYSETKTFPKEELYSLTNQLRRACSSIPSNIAEGCGKTNADLARYLNIALGSANKSEYFLLLAKDPGYMDSIKYGSLNKLVNEIKAMLIALIARIRVKLKANILQLL